MYLSKEQKAKKHSTKRMSIKRERKNTQDR